MASMEEKSSRKTSSSSSSAAFSSDLKAVKKGGVKREAGVINKEETSETKIVEEQAATPEKELQPGCKKKDEVGLC